MENDEGWERSGSWPSADVADMLVELEPATRVGRFELHDMEQGLWWFPVGWQVEIDTPQNLSRRFRWRISGEAEARQVDPWYEGLSV